MGKITNPFGDMAVANAARLAFRYAVSNERDVAAYTALHKQWADRVPLLAGSVPPMEPEPEPGVPTIFEVDQAKAAEIFNAWDEAVQNGDIPSDSEPDYTPAISKSKYQPPVVPGPVVLPQPSRPLGVKIGRGKFAEAPGDKRPVGDVWIDPDSDVEFIKVGEDNPVAGEGSQRYWQVKV